MDKPQPKCEVAIDWIGPKTHAIGFYATQDAVEEFKEFGQIEREGGKWILFVDTRYDFDEIVQYIQNYG